MTFGDLNSFKVTFQLTFHIQRVIWQIIYPFTAFIQIKLTLCQAPNKMF